LHVTAHRKLQFLFLLSGATALVYQVVWTRLLTLFFGSTILAVSTVLAVFMGGLAIGAALLGRMADRTAEPLRLYGKLELVIGLLAMATPLSFGTIEQVYLLINDQAAPGFWAAALQRFALSALLVLPPTLLMGGTLPALCKVFLRADQGGGNTARSIARLYFINTFGAVLGTLAAGLLLLQLMGIQALLLAAGLVNIAIFVFAYRMPRMRLTVPAAVPPAPATSQAVDGFGWSARAVLAVVVLFFSGMAALIYEVAWTRVLTLVIGSSTYALTTMLATFLIGIALGSALVGRYAARHRPGLNLLGWCQVMIGVLALGTAATFGLLPDAFVALFGAVGEHYGLFMLANFLLCFVVMVPATLFMGASFPVASALVVERFDSSGRRIGLLYAGNTIGAILGAFLAGFVLLPRLGIQQTLILTVYLNLVIGLGLSLYVLVKRRKGKHVLSPALATACMLLLLAWQPPWDRLKMTSGPYAYAAQYQQIPIEQRLARIEQLYYREGPVATVSVIREGLHVRLVVDGKTDAGNYRDMTTQVLLGHLPLLVDPEARDVLVIGYASGITAGAVARHPVERIDCVEIEPAMLEASRFFDAENFHIMDDSRFNLIVDDGRSYLAAARYQYDVIISEPSNPWQSGSSRLFTREAFMNARGNLKPGGLMAQWMHLYGVDVETFRLVVRTFRSVFPYVTLWADPGFPDVIFLGSTEPIEVDALALDDLFARDSGVAASLARIGYPDAASLFSAFMLNADETRDYAQTGALNTDNLPLLEYRAPRSLYSPTALQENIRALQKSKSAESFPAIRIGAGEAARAAELLKDWGQTLAARRSIANAKGALARAAELNPADGQAPFVLALLRMQTGDLTGAIASFERAAALRPDLGEAYSHLGTLYLQTGNAQSAYTNLHKALTLGHDSAGLRNNLAVLHAQSGRMLDAVREATLAVSLDPGNQVARDNLSVFRERLEKE
jgi:spermidine synthase